MTRQAARAAAVTGTAAQPRKSGRHRPRPTPAQRRWLAQGLSEPGGKLPLFDEYGQAISPATVRACIRYGWVEPWIHNPIKPDWLVCKLTHAGRVAVDSGAL